jgi:phage baseplate assembly protein W
MATQKTPLGLVLPIQNGNAGFFEQAYDSFTQKRMNVINLLRTKLGERRMQPLFGSRLWTVVFEQNNEILPDVITNVITEDINRWVEGVLVKKVSVQVPKIDETTDYRDIYTVLVTVIFEDVATQQEGSVEILINSGKV